MSGDTSRKPSGSSTHSANQSPSSSPNHNAQTQRRLNSGPPASMYGVGMGTANSLKPGLNTGWQVWGAGAPSSKRNASISSAASANDIPSQSDSNYRTGLAEGWPASRPTSGSWDDVNESSQKKDFAQMDTHSQLNLHQARQRQAATTQPSAFSGPRMDDRSAGSKNGQFSPQRYDGALGKDPSSRYPSSPTRAFGSSPFSGQQNGIQGSYDTLQTSNTVNDDLTLALRGMAVEDDYSVQNRREVPSQGNTQPPHPALRGPPMPHPRGPYTSYPQTDFSYYSSRDSYPDYPYAYEPYRGPSDPSMYTSPVVSSASPGALFPSVSPQSLHPAAISDMHRQQPSYNITQQIASQNMLYGPVRSTPSPLPQAFVPTFDYATQMSMMLPGGGLYAPSPHMFPHNVRNGRRGEGDGHPLRSALLDEFRANKSRKWELRDIFGYIVEFSGDQHGSRFIQQKLETASSEEKQIVFDEIVPNNALQLITDVFGNYVIQKLFEHGTQVQKTVLANTMEGHVLTLSLQMYGCRVVQKAIEYILPEQQGSFVRELEPHVLKCVKDANGNHVIQKLIERVSPDRLAFVNAFRGNVYELSTHPYGCRVLQRCLEHLPDDQTRPLLDELHKYTINLMQDQFGNYVIQFVLEHGKPQDRAQVISRLRGQMLQMARHKFASNVCEKALVCADSESRKQLIDEIMTPKQDGVSPIVTMMKDQFANYVLQRALSVVEGEQRDILVGKVRPQLVSMRRYSSAYSKHLVAIERLLEKFPPTPESSSNNTNHGLNVIPPELLH
ncbi:hypothetical protein AX16_003722 [Volvariella volvacea WC 439]|nr:hypothetical protein AX16_003722 [Volvariella volvacea WC 439]